MKLNKEEVDQAISELEENEEISCEIRNGEKLYFLNKKGRERLAKRAIEALGKLDFKIATKGMNDLKDYVETGKMNKFSDQMIGKLLPFVMERQEEGMSDDEIKANLNKYWVD